MINNNLSAVKLTAVPADNYFSKHESKHNPIPMRLWSTSRYPLKRKTPLQFSKSINKLTRKLIENFLVLENQLKFFMTVKRNTSWLFLKPKLYHTKILIYYLSVRLT